MLLLLMLGWGLSRVGKADLGVSWQDMRLCGEVDGAVVWVQGYHSCLIL